LPDTTPSITTPIVVKPSAIPKGPPLTPEQKTAEDVI